MNLITSITLKAATTAVVGSILLVGYVASQWPPDVQELKIPPGKVEPIPGTDHKGILVQGQRGGLALYYSVMTIKYQGAKLEIASNQVFSVKRDSLLEASE